MIRQALRRWRFGLELGRLERSYAQLGTLDDPVENSVVRSVREDGYHVWPGFYSHDETRRLAAAADTLLNKAEHGQAIGAGAKVQRQDVNTRIVHIKGVAPDIDELLINNPRFGRMASAYYNRSMCSCNGILQESRPLQGSADSIGFGISGFHFDGLKRTFKVFVYLEDCGVDNGPFTIVPRSSNVDAYGKRQKMFECRFGGGEGATYYSPEASERLGLTGRQVQVTGCAGTVFFADTRSLHVAGTVLSGRRRVLVLYFKA